MSFLSQRAPRPVASKSRPSYPRILGVLAATAALATACAPTVTSGEGGGGSGGSIVVPPQEGGVAPVCFDVGWSCTEDAECCLGACNGNVCVDPRPPPLGGVAPYPYDSGVITPAEDGGVVPVEDAGVVPAADASTCVSPGAVCTADDECCLGLCTDGTCRLPDFAGAPPI